MKTVDMVSDWLEISLKWNLIFEIKVWSCSWLRFSVVSVLDFWQGGLRKLRPPCQQIKVVLEES